MALSISQKVVLNRENTWGSPRTAPNDDLALPVESASINLIIEPFNDQTKRGSVGLDSQVYATVRRVEGSVEGPFYVDEASYFILALLGDEALVATAASAPTTHTFLGKTSFTQPLANSLTIDVLDDTKNFEYTGCYVSSFTLRFSAAEGILTYTANLMGKTQGTSMTLSDKTFADQPAPFGWRTAVHKSTNDASRTADNEATVLGLSKVCSVIDAEFTFNRPTALTYTFCETDEAFRADPGPMEVTVRLTLDWDDDADIDPDDIVTEYTANTPSAWIFKLDNNVSTPPEDEREILIFLPHAYMIDGPLEIDRGDTAIRVNLSLRAVNNSVAAINGPVRIKTMGSRAVEYEVDA